jgi:DNA repair exonuclease SbcCD ATPase subunit
MKAILVFVALCVAVASALPPGYNSASELATVLANEPDAARFASASSGGDTITFKDDSASHGHGGHGGDKKEDEGDADVAEFDAQIEQIQVDLKKLKEAIKESEECARRLAEQQAEVRSLQEQKEHLEKEKEKRILQAKLDRQMKDLAEINRMSRSLRTKFSELKHTQKLIKTKMSGTRNSLQQLDSDGDAAGGSEIGEAADAIGAEVDAMQKAQSEMLAREHHKNAQAVKGAVKKADNDFHKHH